MVKDADEQIAIIKSAHANALQAVNVELAAKQHAVSELQARFDAAKAELEKLPKLEVPPGGQYAAAGAAGPDGPLQTGGSAPSRAGGWVHSEDEQGLQRALQERRRVRVARAAPAAPRSPATPVEPVTPIAVPSAGELHST